MQHQLTGQLLHIYSRNVVLIYISLIVIVGLIAIWSVLPARNKTTGLEGTWSSVTNPRYSYEFRCSGKVDVRCQDSIFKNILTWERIGYKIIVRTADPSQSPVGEWTFKGRLQEQEIRGVATLRTPGDSQLSFYDEVWVREQANSTLGISSGTLRQDLAI
ncbi:MAG TPA: hypothetical protein PLN21_00680 [Gemmatales bacterium]|nr:hypothetical protein [Gemmatales bacterium]